MRLAGLFGLLTIVIAAVGIYGVMAYIMTQRTREIGVRMALGAQRGQVLRTVLTRAGVILGTGLALGIAGAWPLATVLERLLFEIRPHDPSVFGEAVLVLVTSGFLAAWLPARRATRVEPPTALRDD